MTPDPLTAEPIPPLNPDSDTPMADLGGRVLAIAHDGDLGGDEMAVAVALATLTSEGPDQLTIENLQRRAFPYDPASRLDRGGALVPEWRFSRAARVIAEDARRYRAPEPHGKCGAPDPRKGTCGRRPELSSPRTDWATGTTFWVEACSRHREWRREQLAEHEATKPQIGRTPEPFANFGGRIARHFPEIDWPGVWQGVRSSWTPRPEKDPVEWGDLPIHIELEETVSPRVVELPRRPQEQEKKPDRYRYRFRGKLNRTQAELLRLADMGSLRGHRTVIHARGGGRYQWYPTDVPVHQGGLWVPGLVEAGLLWIKQTTRGDHGVQYGLYRLTSEGRRWLNDEAGK